MKKRTKRILLNLAEGIITLIIMILAFFLLINITLKIVYNTNNIKNYSMQPTLNSGVTSQTQEGDFIFVNKFSSYKTGDIVVAKVTWWDTPVIKRLVGCPGDKIQIKEADGYYHLYVNGNILYSKEITTVSLHGKPTGSKELYERYLKFIEGTLAGGSNKDISKNIGTYNGEICIQLNEDEYFFMGDNWGESDDSMMFGPSSKKTIEGKVDYVIPLGENKFIYFTKFVFNMIFTQNKYVY